MGQLLLEHVHGAATRVGVEETAFPHRAEGYNFVLLSQSMDPAITDRCIAWAREAYQQMEPFAAAGRYVNYLGDEAVYSRARALARLKNVIGRVQSPGRRRAPKGTLRSTRVPFASLDLATAID